MSEDDAVTPEQERALREMQDALAALVPGAIEWANQIATFLNRAGIRACNESALALFLVAASAAHQNTPRPIPHAHVYLLFEFAWNVVTAGGVELKPEKRK